MMRRLPLPPSRTPSRPPSRPPLALLAPLALLLSALAPARARAECDGAAPEARDLAARLERASTQGAWRALYAEALSLEGEVERRRALDASRAVVQEDAAEEEGGAQGSAQPTPAAEAPAAEAPGAERAAEEGGAWRATLSCLARARLSASFYLSDEPTGRLLWSTRALSALAELEALEALLGRAPSADERARRSSRARELQARAARAATAARLSWLEPRGLVRLTVPPLARPLTLTLSPPSADEWRRACGIAPECAEPPSWSVALGGDREVSFTLPAGEYEARWSGPCAQSSALITLSAREATHTLTPPPLSCRSPLRVVDARTLDPLDAPIDALGEGERAEVRVEGYEPLTVVAPAGGAPVEARLRRCAARLSWSVTPADAAVEAPRAVRWGAPVTLRASREGYLPLERVVEAPRPERCAGAALRVDLALSRPVRVKARDADARAAVPLERLSVGGLAAPPSGLITRPPGTYALAAAAAGYEPFSGALTVPPCGPYEPSAPGEGRRAGPEAPRDLCAEATLTLALEPLRAPLSASGALRRLGLSVGAAGVALFGLSALELSRYQSSPPSPLLSDRRALIDEARLWSVSLIGAGALTYAVGLLLPQLSSTPAPAAPAAPASPAAPAALAPSR